jgi:foldase protein PrsA
VKSGLLAILIASLGLCGCHSQSASAGRGGMESIAPVNPDDQILATVRGDKITRGDLEPVLMDGYGLKILLDLVQLDLVEQEAAKVGVTVTPADVARERTITMQNLRRATEETDGSGQPTTEPTDNLTADQENQLLNQLLDQQHVTQTEFNLILHVNAYLRKIAGPTIDAKLTDEAVRQQFNIMYGEKVVVHYIVCNDMSEAAAVRRDLAAGKSFEDVARARSLDRQTAYTGGELPPFTLQDNRFPQEFKQVAFSLKKGEISDPVQINRFIYIVKLADRIPPAHAKFSDYRDSVRKYLRESTVQAAMKVMRDRLGALARESLNIRDPVLARQWADELAQKTGAVHNMDEIRQEMDRQHGPATNPSAARAGGAAASTTMPVGTR